MILPASSRRAVCLLLLAAMLGCSNTPSPPPPPTYPLTGKVLFRNGKPFPGGIIHFISKAEPSLAINGTIKEDGTFEVFTIYRGEPLPGAVRGPVQVMVSPPLKESKPVEIYQPTKEFEVKEGENRFVIELDTPKR